MLKIVRSDQMREMDRFTIEELGVPGVVLMENAGVGSYRIIREMLPTDRVPLVSIFCGKGNNGGDGLVVARHLWDDGVAVEVFIFGKEEEIRGDARTNLNIVQNFGIPVQFVSNLQQLQNHFDPSTDLVVDALLGTGIKGAVYGLMKEAIEFINSLDAMVVSIDVPSGLNADSPVVEGVAVSADATVTMALPKHCHLFYPAREFVGDLHVVDIGIPHYVRQSEGVKIQLVEDADIELPARPEYAHKYTCGKVAVLAGSPGFTGAAALTAEAALRIGAGLVKLAVPESLNPILETKLTEVITVPYTTGKSGQFNEHSLAELEELLEWCDVLAIGPGLGRGPETQKAILAVLEKFTKPAVIDADALFALANQPLILNQPHPQWVLTPHHGEFRRFLPEIGKEELQRDFVKLAQETAGKFQLHLLLKGAPSLVATPEGEVFVNSTGNAGLASGGTGDVLTGMVAGLLAQGLPPQQAAYTANFLHGLVADEVADQESIYTLVAGDLIRHLGPVLNKYFG